MRLERDERRRRHTSHYFRATEQGLKQVSVHSAIVCQTAGPYDASIIIVYRMWLHDTFLKAERMNIVDASHMGTRY